MRTLNESLVVAKKFEEERTKIEDIIPEFIWRGAAAVREELELVLTPSHKILPFASYVKLFTFVVYFIFKSVH